ncbi:MAG: glycoside hydrolase family 5 protein [Oscillospiraceae bacterium]
MNLKKAASVITAVGMAAAMLLTGCSSGGNDDNVRDTGSSADASETAKAAKSDESAANELTATEVIKLMGNGINLGNTMEAYGHENYAKSGVDPTSFETLWGQPVTTKEMIEDMKAMGFDTLRVPVAWTNGINYESGDYTIDERLMNRVDEIVNYALDADMYVIVNDHWDGSWWGMFGSEDEAVREKAMELYKSMWTQICEHFADYSYKLIFESANEELGDRLNDKDVTGTEGVLTADECYEKTNEINSEFVKLVRSTGGKNADRFLLIAGYNTDIAKTCDGRYKMPEDTAKDKLLVSVHYYTPWDYCATEAINRWGSPDDYDEQNSLFQMLTKFTDEGYGVVIGEYAVMGKTTKPDTDKFYNNLLDNCDLYNYCPVLWDCSNLYRRSLRKVDDEAIAQIFKDRCAANEEGKDYADIQSAAKESMDKAHEAANDTFMEGVSIPASDDTAVAWIMYQSADYSVAYSVGDKYDPTNMTLGIAAENVEITGEGTYTVSLDFTGCGGTKGVAFSALGIYNGEKFFPGYTITIDEIKINGETRELTGKDYTCSDDYNCTRVNLYNQWVKKVPEEARRADGDLSEASPTILSLTDKEKISTIEITFTYAAP